MQNFIFNRKYLTNQLKNFEIEQLEEKHTIIRNWNYSLTKSDLERTKEEAIQGDFLTQIFSVVLGYKGRIGEDLWNLQSEEKTQMDGTKADGSLGFFTSTIKDVRVVIELKNAKSDLDRKQNRSNNQSPVEQAFSYQYKHKNCKWVIVANFKEIRLYSSTTMTEYELFLMKDLAEDIEVFKKFCFLLGKDRLINRDAKSKNDLLYELNEQEELKITNEFYKEYKEIRTQLYQHISFHNPAVSELVVFEKTQKILDRFIFVCFCEDTELLPDNIFRQVVETAKNSFDMSETRIWNQLKGLFHSIDKGNPPMNINRYNGGLFALDDVLDNFVIKDEIFSLFQTITTYDFGSELSVNILGHVFEQSISDMEEFKSEISGEELDKNKGKRKRDGIFYTPAYVTHFIVSKTIGDWLDDQKEKLGFSKLPEIPEFHKKMTAQEKANHTKALKANTTFWQRYQDVLRNIKVLDPACGSGAFLVQAFDYLVAEGERVNEELYHVLGGQTALFDLNKHILKNNLYGIDVNQESVEITKLSLWIKTVNKNDPLTSLDENIRCGDSLVNDVYPDGYFDIILGNPPYVRQERIVHLKHHLEDKYRVYHSGLDLFGYFYEKSFSFLKQGGYIGFISNSFTKTNSGIHLRTFLKDQTQFVSYVDFTDVQIFKGAITYPVVMILKKENKNKKNTFRYYKVKKEELNALSSHFEKKFNTIIQREIDNENWDFVIEEEKKLKDKLFSYPTIKGQFGKTYYGLKTGLNKAFIIDKDVYQQLSDEAEELLVQYLEGKDLKKWAVGDVPKWLIYIRKGWTKKTFGEDITEENAKRLMESKYPILFKHLNLFEEDGKKRSDQGDFWWELRSCDYIDLFEKTKIGWPNLQASPKFSIDSTGCFLNAPAVMLSTNQKWVLGVLNSSLSWYILKSLCVVRSGGYIEVKPQFLENFPIPILKKNPIELENKVDEIIELTQLIEQSKKKFFSFLENEFELSKITRNLNNFHEQSFKDFTKELQKQKILLSQQDKYELVDIFTSESIKIQKLSQHIIQLESELDQLVFNLYKLNEIEKDIIQSF